MPKNYFLPADDAGKCLWISHFATRLVPNAATVGVTTAETTSTQDDSTFFNWVCNNQALYQMKARDWTAYKNALRDGHPAGPIPPSLAATTPPTAVLPGIFDRATLLVGRIKKHPGYTEAIGQDLGIIGAEVTVNLAGMKPVLTLTLQAGHPNVGWTKQGMDSLEIHVDRGSGVFVFLAIDTIPEYLDTAALPAPGTSAAWKYKAIYRLRDEQVGQWSDVASISVMG